ncbi:Gfo/Idh/MocA family protein [Microbacterium halophytorum]|uniref:Gfo/Idh/MocA family protein n=1 Tax=Microbacterium halophytorum TaxID=2067568 RepID=UPI000CFBEED4|nr:Gfo/Idh/MocA family oxidoreductase [Microbacterium halophytorum]
MTNDLRIGVVGAGAMGADHIARIEHRVAGAHVSAVIEPDAGRAAAAAESAPMAQTFARIEDALAAGAIDAALIAVPGQFHLPVLIPALEAGLPILCEKPLTPDSETSLRVLEAEQKLDKPHIQVGFMRRFDPEYAQLRELVESGDAGELVMLRCAHRNPSVPDSYVQPMLINDSVVHEFDVVPWLAGSPLKSVEVKFARQNPRTPERLREPILVIMELANGVLVDVEMNVSVQFGYQVTTEAVFSEGIARIGDPQGLTLWQGARVGRREHTSFTTRFAEAYDNEIQRWVDAVRRGDLVDGPNAWDGYLVAVACEAGVRALEGGGVQPIETADRPAFYS